MSTVVNFGGKQIIEPGVYARIVSGSPAQPSTFSTGNVCIIDTGAIGVGFGGGSGINGTNANGLKAVYSFQDVTDFNAFVRGGLLYDMSDLIFSPQVGESGPAVVHLIRAARTTPAEIEFVFTGGGPNGGKVKFLTQNEGECANGRVAEDLATSSISVVGPILVGDVANIQVTGGVSLTGTLTATTTSTSDFAEMIMEAINGNTTTTGFTAQIQGGDVIVTAPTGTGASGNSISLSTMNLPVQGTLSAPTITGGVNSVSATATWYFTVPGDPGDVIGFGNNTAPNEFFGFLTVLAGATNQSNAEAYRDLINGGTGTHGYTATAPGVGQVIITAPTGTGATINGNAIQVTTVVGTVDCSGAIFVYGGGVNETLGDVDLTITHVGQSGSTISTIVDGVALGVYTTNGLGSTAAFATAYAAYINANTTGGIAHGFTATVAGSVVTIVCPVGTGNTMNGDSVVLSTPFGTVPYLTVTPFSGGSDSGMLTIGYGAQMLTGTFDVTKFAIAFYEGTYRGKTLGGNDIENQAAEFCQPILIAKSPEFNNIKELIAWAKADYNLKKRFLLSPDYLVSGTGAVTNVDLVAYNEINLAVDGTTIYDAASLDRVLEEIRELDNTFFLCDRWGDEAQGVQNNKIIAHIQQDAEMQKFMVVGGGIDETKFEDGVTNSSIMTAKFFNDVRSIVVHSGNKRILPNGDEEKLPAMYHAANIVGRLGGLEPQTPLTFKAIKTTNFNHQMQIRERERALQAGVVHNRTVPGIGNVVNQGINSLQRNTILINPDGTSFEISIMRIAAQLNKELVLNMRPLFTGNNWGSASPADVKSFVEAYLFRRTATADVDNLIILFKNVKVRLIEDYYDVQYAFEPNGPINKIFTTGFMLTSNLSA